MGTLVFQATLGGAINLIGPNTASTVNFTLPSADGSSGQALTTNGSGTLAFTTVTGVPGGSTTQVQYNSSGAFAGSANLTFNGTTFSAPNSVITSSSSSNALRITQTGAGNAILVEDSANPDSSPFVVDSSGIVLVGQTTKSQLNHFTDANLLQISSTYTSGIQTGVFSNDAFGASLFLSKSRGTSVGTNTIVSSGDFLGSILFNGADGTNYIRAAQIQAEVDGTPGTNDMPGRLVFSTTADGASSPTERVRIASTGAIGLSGANYGTSGQVLTSGGSSATPTWTTVSGGGGTPGGSTTQLQYNNAGAFGGISGVTTDGTRMTASTTIGVGGATPSTSGSGITFPATQSASTDANTLDDYEEGTWTPNIDGGYNTSNTVTYTTQSGSYTKVGRLVVVAYFIQINTWSGNAGPVFFGGLPFNPATQTDARFQGTAYLSGPDTPSLAVNANLGYARLDNGSYYLVFNFARDNTAMDNGGTLTGGNFAAGDVVAGTFTYFV